jgi:hypothetical protein
MSVRLLDCSAFRLRFAHTQEVPHDGHFILKSKMRNGPPQNGLFRVTQSIAAPGFYVMSAEFICLMPDEGQSRESALEYAQEIQRLVLAA